MSGKITYDYFYGGHSDAFSYYRIPRLLITGQQFKGLSTDAKLLYGLLLDRMGLSSRNGWYDGQGRVYIYYPLDEIRADLNCGHDKAVKLLAELDTGKGIGLIERVKQGQGRPAKIYVKQFTTTEIPQPPAPPPEPEEPNPRLPKTGSQDCGISEVLTAENQTSRLLKNGSADFGKSDGSYNNIIYPENSYLDPSIYPSQSIAVRQMDRCEVREEVKENIEYQRLAEQYGHKDADEILDLITDTLCSIRPTIRIGGKEIPIEAVKDRFWRLEQSHTQKYPTTENGNQIRFPSRRAGQRVRRDRPTQRGGWCEGRSEHHRAGEQPGGKAVGRDPAGRMILASAMRHSVGRPAMGMGGGTKTYGAALPAAVWIAFAMIPLYENRAETTGAVFVVSCHVMRPNLGRIGREVFSWQAVPKRSRQRERKR